MVYQPGVLYYKNRAGEKVGPVTPDPYHGGTYLNLNGTTRWFGPNFKGGQFTGRGFQHIDHHNDLIEPWTDEIGEQKMTVENNLLEYTSVVKDGDYGIVQIECLGDAYKIFVDEQYVSVQELRHAAKVFEELAAFIESQD